MKSLSAWLIGCLSLTLIITSLLGLPRCSSSSYYSRDAAVESSTGNNDWGPSPDQSQNPCAPNPPPSVSGRVLAPNGIDPVAGASIGIPIALKALPQSVECESCSVGGRFAAHVYAGPDGSFQITGVPNGEPFSLAIQKGHFRRVIKDVTVPQCGHLDLSKELTTLPGRNKQWNDLDEIPSIAIISGVYDHLEKVLEKLGVQEKTIYNGRDYGSGGPGSFQELMQNNVKLHSHHLLLIDCGIRVEYSALAADLSIRANLRDYLRAGGRILATDRSYDFIEQVFPEFIEWERSQGGPADQPEEIGVADVGSDMTEDVPALVLDTRLKAWLALPEINALLAGDIVPVSGLHTGWAVMKDVNAAVGGKVWLKAPVIWAGGKDVRPLAASCDYRDKDGKGCGRAMFSSYHTYGEGAELLPQERLLEYLILEIGACAVLQ